MHWDDLRTFHAIAQTGTLSGAARMLGVTQPTMGRRLKAMEERTGARLLDRTPGGYVLTPLGEAIVDSVRRIEHEALSVERRIAGNDVRLEGTVRVTTIEIFASGIVVPAARTLRERHPAISVEVTPDTRSFSLSRREADIALRVWPFEGQELVVQKVGRLRFGLYAGTVHLGDFLETENAPRADSPVIGLLDDQAHLPEAAWLASLLPDAPVALRSNDRNLHATAAAAGVGLACLPLYRGEPDPALTRILPGTEGPVRDIWLGVHGDLRHVPRIRATLSALKTSIERQRSAL